MTYNQIWFLFLSSSSVHCIHVPHLHYFLFLILTTLDLKEEFKLVPKNMISVSGDTVILECIPPRGYPEPTVLWKKDGNIINLINDRIKLIKGSNIMISNVHPSDKGSYTCVAQNMIGSRESQPAATLKVMGKYQIRK